MSKNPENETENQEEWPLKAYKNLDFLKSEKARFIRILCELFEPEERFKENGVENTIVLFGSARTKPLKEAEAQLKSINALIAESPNQTKPYSNSTNKLKSISNPQNIMKPHVNCPQSSQSGLKDYLRKIGSLFVQVVDQELWKLPIEEPLKLKASQSDWGSAYLLNKG